MEIGIALGVRGRIASTVKELMVRARARDRDRDRVRAMVASTSLSRS